MMKLSDSDELMDKMADSFIEFLDDHDVVRVVRCKDCYNSVTHLDHLYCESLCARVNDDWYCANGKRKDEVN